MSDHFRHLIETLINSGAHSAVKYLTPNEVVRATRTLYKTKKSYTFGDKRQIEIRLNICRPNYLEREFIKSAKAAGVAFPIRKVQLKFPPKRRAA